MIYRLSRRALLDLRHIYNYSTKTWGEDKAADYIRVFYAAFQQLTLAPDLGEKKRKRAYPFYMIAVQQHFVIYDSLPDVILVLSIFHQKRDIETLTKAMRNDFFKEIEALKKDIR